MDQREVVINSAKVAGAVTAVVLDMAIIAVGLKIIITLFRWVF